MQMTAEGKRTAEREKICGSFPELKSPAKPKETKGKKKKHAGKIVGRAAPAPAGKAAALAAKAPRRRESPKLALLRKQKRKKEVGRRRIFRAVETRECGSHFFSKGIRIGIMGRPDFVHLARS